LRAPAQQATIRTVFKRPERAVGDIKMHLPEGEIVFTDPEDAMRFVLGLRRAQKDGEGASLSPATESRESVPALPSPVVTTPGSAARRPAENRHNLPEAFWNELKEAHREPYNVLVDHPYGITTRELADLIDYGVQGIGGLMRAWRGAANRAGLKEEVVTRVRTRLADGNVDTVLRSPLAGKRPFKGLGEAKVPKEDDATE
jgi:hypothetical protein